MRENSYKSQADIFLPSVVNFTFSAMRCIRKITVVGCFYFAVEILKFIATDEREDVICNYSSLVSVENSDVEQFRPPNVSLKYFPTAQSVLFKLELTLNELFYLQLCPS